MENEEVKESFIDEKTGIEYIRNGDIYLPNISIDNKKTVNLGKYCLMRLNYLKEHKKAIYTVMKIKGTLQEHLIEIDKECRAMENKLVQEIAEKENINEELKQKDQIKWVGLMNATKNQAEEIILSGLIYK